jgi:hypothetical protein
MTFKVTMLPFPILAGVFFFPILVQAQAVNTTVYAAGQESVQICLPTTGSYTPEVCEENFDPVGLCEEGEEAELDHCSTYSDAPLCSQNGQRGQDCVCYYFCKKPAVTPGPKGGGTTLLNDYGTIDMTSRGAGEVEGTGNPDALFAFSHVNSRGQTYYLHSKDVQLRGSGRTQTIYYFAKEVKAGAMDDIPAGTTIVENERTGLLFLKGK